MADPGANRKARLPSRNRQHFMRRAVIVMKEPPRFDLSLSRFPFTVHRSPFSAELFKTYSSSSYGNLRGLTCPSYEAFNPRNDLLRAALRGVTRQSLIKMWLCKKLELYK
jgi:hypothetical protein